MSVLVLVMSQKCGACQRFKKSLPELEKPLNNDKRFEFVVLEFDDFTIPAPKGNQYHPELRNFIKWFPSFILFPSNLWNNHKSTLKGVIKHGDEATPKIDYSLSSLNSWISEALKNPMFSN